MKISRWWMVIETAICLLAIGILIFDVTMDGNASRYLWKLTTTATQSATKAITKLLEIWQSNPNRA